MDKLLIGAIIGVIALLTFKISVSGVKKLVTHEGLRLQPYKDQAGKWTIGYGHLIKPNENYLLNPAGITQEKAEELLRGDLQHAEKAVNSYVTVPLTGNQFDALVSFVYNVGNNAFASSTLLKKLNNKDYKGAANEFPRWKYTGGKVSKGLINRREKERNLFLYG